MRAIPILIAAILSGCAAENVERDGEFELFEDAEPHIDFNGVPVETADGGIDANICQPRQVVLDCQERYGYDAPMGAEHIEETCIELGLGCCDADYFFNEEVANCIVDEEGSFTTPPTVGFLKEDDHNSMPVWELMQGLGGDGFQACGLHAQTGDILWFEDIEGCSG